MRITVPNERSIWKEDKGVKSTTQAENIMVVPGNNNPLSEHPKNLNGVQSSGTDIRASMRQAESSIGARLLANQLQADLKLLDDILEKILEWMSNPRNSSQPAGDSSNLSSIFPSGNVFNDATANSPGKNGSAGDSESRPSTPLALGRRFTPGASPNSGVSASPANTGNFVSDPWRSLDKNSAGATVGQGNPASRPSTPLALGRRFTPANIAATTEGLATTAQTDAATVEAPVNVSNESGPQSETDIAIDPTNPNHIIGGSNDINTGSMRVYESLDGGKTWTNTAMPSAPSPYDGFASDPGVTFDSAGNAYYSYLGVQASIFGASGTTLVVSKKPAGASSWGSPVVVPNTNADKNLMTADRTNSQFSGNLYVSWDNNNADNTQSLMTANSTDGGQTWTPVKVNNTGTNVIGANTAVGPNGEVYTAWSNYASGVQTIYINSSLDGGKTWGTTDNAIHQWNANTGGGLSINIPADPQRGVPVFPFIDVDRSNGPNRGTIYALYNDTQPGGSTLDVYLTSSKDGGKTWSTPVKVNDDSAPGHDHFMPRLAVDDSDGSINIGWYDTRNDPNNKQADFYYTRSTDGGKTFEPNVKVTKTPLDESGSGADPNGYGDYSGIAAYKGVVRPLWAGTSSGSQAEDIFSATITNTQTPPPPPPAFPVPPDNLRRGSRGVEVNELQRDIAHLGFNPGPIDGIFGPRTQAALKAFQSANGLKPDGIYGPLTRAALKKALNE